MSDPFRLHCRLPAMDASRPIVMVDDEELDFLSASRFHRRSRLCNPLLRCNDGSEFLDYLGEVKRGEKAVPMLVLMDVNMPGLTGFEVVQAMREDSDFADEPVVAMLTSSCDPHDHQRAAAVGVSCFLMKPFDPRAYQSFFDSLID